MEIKGNINAGYGNIISGTTIKSSILGGENNNMSTSPGQPQVIHSSIVGGVNNGVYRELSVILNGYNNNVSAPLAATVTERKNTILNGNNNLIANGADDLIGGGNFNTIDGTYYNRFGTSPNRKNTILNGYNSSINASIYNFIGGGLGNVIEYYGGYDNIVGGYQNRIFGSFTSIIGGGAENFIGYGRNNIIGSGRNNILTGSTNETVIVGGRYNYITDSDTSSIVGGSNNRLLGVANTNRRTFIGGGINNTITASTTSSIVGGENILINNSPHSVIGGGENNTIESASDVVIGGGKNNYIGDGADHSIIIGGEYNYIKPIGLSGPFIQTHNLIGGGYGNRISLYSNLNPSDGKGNNIILNSKKATMYGYSYRNHNTILNTGWIFSTPISNYSSGIHGGSHNSILGGAASYLDRNNNPTTGLTHAIIGYSYLSTLVSGYGNMINDATYSTIVNGYHNYIGGGNNLKSNFIGTGYGNKISKSSDYSMIGGGDRNAMYYTQGSFISSGRFNTISGTSTSYYTQSRQSSILGGRSNLLRSSFSSIIGGRDNTINLSSTYSSILGGQNNTINHSNSHIIGSNLTSISANTTHVERLNIGTVDTGSTSINVLTQEGNGMVNTRPLRSVINEDNTAAVSVTMTEVDYPHDTLISLTLNASASNNFTYTLPAPTEGLKYTWVFKTNAGVDVTASFGYTSDVVGGFVHSSDDDILTAQTGIGTVRFDAGFANAYDKVEFVSDGVRWYYEIHHNGPSTDFTYLSNS